MADPVSVVTYVAAVISVAGTMDAMVQKQVDRFKTIYSAERAAIKDFETISSRIVGCLEYMDTKHLRADDEARLQKVFSTLSDIRAMVTRSRSRRELRQALDKYREQCEILEKTFANRKTEDSSTKVGSVGVDKAPNGQHTIHPSPTKVDKAERSRSYFHLEPVNEPNNCAIDIIFVHGFCGHARKTWTGIADHAAFWPERFLAVDKELPPCHILTYGYDTSHYFKEKSRFDSLVFDFRNSLHDHIRARKVSGCTGVVLVAHSLGGLLVKAAIAKEHKDMFSSLKLALMFFGTPHSFSSVSARASLFRAIISASASQTTPPLSNKDIDRISELSSRDSSSDYERAFTNVLNKELKDTHIVSFFEMDATLTERGNLRLVEEFNTKSGHAQEKFCLLPGNHITMCKFESRDDNGYIQFVRELKNVTKNFESTPRLGTLQLYYSSPAKVGMESEAGEMHTVSLNVDGSNTLRFNTSRRSGRGSVSTQSSGDDGAKTDLALDFSKWRPWFEVPMAKWHTFKQLDQSHGTWFLSSGEFARWLGNREEKALVLRGPSGCGRTLVAESILMSLSKPQITQSSTKTTCVLQLFFRFEEIVGHELCNVLKALIAQVLDLNPTLIWHVKQIVGRDPDKSVLSEDVLLDILRRVLQDTCWTDIYLIIDALDECSDVSSSFFNAWSAKPMSILEGELSLSPLRKLFRLFMDWPTLRLVTTMTQEVYGLPTSTLWPSEKGQVIVEVELCKLEEFKKVFNQFLDSQIDRRIQSSTPAMKESAYPKHLRQLALELACSPHPSFRLAHASLEYFDLLWKSTSEPARQETVWSTRFAEIQHRHILYSQLLEASEIGQDPGYPRALAYLPRLQQPVDLAALEMIIRLGDADPSNLEDAIQSLTRDSTALNWKEVSWAVTTDGSTLHLCSDDIRRFCLSRLDCLGSQLGETPESQRILEMKRANMTYEIHVRIARACLKLLRLHDEALSLSPSHVESPTTTVPALNYAETFWSRHVRLAGPRASELDSLIAQRAHDGKQVARHPASQLLTRLATDNLSFSITTMFSRPSELVDISPEEISRVFDEVVLSSSVPTLKSLHRLEKKKKLRKSSSGTLSTRDIVFYVRTFDIANDSTGLLKRVIAESSFDKKQIFLRYALQFRKTSTIYHILDVLDKTASLAPTTDYDKELWAVAVSAQDQRAIERMALRSTLFDKNTGLLIAASNADVKSCGILLSHKADPNHHSRDGGKTALHIASETGQLSLVDLLLKWRAQPTARDSDKRTALHLATKWGHTDVVRYFLRTSTLREEVDRFERTPLFEACARGYKTTAAHLWSSGSNLAHKDKSGRSVLHAAAARGSTDLVRLLLDAGVSVNAKARRGQTPLHEAAEHGYGPVVDILLNAGASIFVKDGNGLTPLHRACLGQITPEVVAVQLLRLGADVNAVTHSDANRPDLRLATPLHIAAKSGTARLVEILLSFPGTRQSLTKLDKGGNTPFLCAYNSLPGPEKAAKMKLLEKQRSPSSAR